MKDYVYHTKLEPYERSYGERWRMHWGQIRYALDLLLFCFHSFPSSHGWKEVECPEKDATFTYSLDPNPLRANPRHKTNEQ